MYLTSVRPLYERPGPWASVLLDVSGARPKAGSIIGRRTGPLGTRRDDQPDVSVIPNTDADDAPTDLSEGDRDDRARLGAYVRRSVFPADRDALLTEARANNAPDRVIAELDRLEAGREFPNAAEAWAAATGAPAKDRRF